MKKALLVIALLAAVPCTSLAEESEFVVPIDEEEHPRKVSLFVYPLVEHYRWMEFFDGAKIEEDEGELFGAGAQLSFERDRSLGRIKGEWFQGSLNGEGVTQLGIPWKTDITYFGFTLEADGAWRFPSGRFSIAPVLGAGYRWWRRDYENSATVTGGLEKWHSVYVKIGALAECNLGAGFVPYAEGGVRLGVFNNNEVTRQGTRVSLDPGGRLTPYAEVGIKAAFLKLAAYYQRLEFSQSTPEEAPGLPPGWGLVEPESKTNIYGARAGIVF